MRIKKRMKVYPSRTEVATMILGRTMRELAIVWPRSLHEAERGLTVLDLSEGRGVAISSGNMEIEEKVLNWLFREGYIEYSSGERTYSAGLTQSGVDLVESLDAYRRYKRAPKGNSREQWVFALEAALAMALGPAFVKALTEDQIPATEANQI